MRNLIGPSGRGGHLPLMLSLSKHEAARSAVDNPNAARRPLERATLAHAPPGVQRWRALTGRAPVPRFRMRNMRVFP